MPGTTYLDILPPSEKGPSAELNTEEEVVVPAIYTYNIPAKLRLIEKFGGKKLKDKTPIAKMKNMDTMHYLKTTRKQNVSLL